VELKFISDKMVVPKARNQSYRHAFPFLRSIKSRSPGKLSCQLFQHAGGCSKEEALSTATVAEAAVVAFIFVGRAGIAWRSG